MDPSLVPKNQFYVENGYILSDPKIEKELSESAPIYITGDDRITMSSITKYEYAEAISQRVAQISNGNKIYLEEHEMIIPLSSEFISEDSRMLYIKDSQSNEGQKVISEEHKYRLIDSVPHISITSSMNIAILEFNLKRCPIEVRRLIRNSLLYPGKKVYEVWLVKELKCPIIPFVI